MSKNRLRNLPAEVQLEKAKAIITGLKREVKVAHNALMESEESIQAVLGMVDGKPKVYVPKRYIRSKTGVGILGLGDMHIGKVIKQASVDNYNAYNKTIIPRRKDNLINSFMYMLENERKLAEIKRLVIILGGDILDGHLHEDSQIDMDPIEQVIYAEEMLSDILMTILKRGQFQEVEVYCLYGNHDRMTPRIMIAKLSQTSLAQVMYRMLAKRFEKESKIYFNIAESYEVQFNINKFKVKIQHGHMIRGGNGIGGIYSAVARYLRKSRDDADLNWIFHFHSFAYMPGNRVLMNPCFCGYDAYARDMLRVEGQPPAQAFAVYDRGHITKAMELWV